MCRAISESTRERAACTHRRRREEGAFIARALPRRRAALSASLVRRAAKRTPRTAASSARPSRLVEADNPSSIHRASTCSEQSRFESNAPEKRVAESRSSQRSKRTRNLCHEDRCPTPRPPPTRSPRREDRCPTPDPRPKRNPRHEDRCPTARVPRSLVHPRPNTRVRSFSILRMEPQGPEAPSLSFWRDSQRTCDAA